MNGFRDERDRLLDMYYRAKGEERISILAKLVVLDDEAEYEQRKRSTRAAVLEGKP